MSKDYSICVYCGSRDGKNPAYAEAADAMGQAIAKERWRLVYGAGDVGLMGRVARAVQWAGGPTFGVIPRHLMDREVGKKDLTTLVITETMHERKKIMFDNADAVVVLPGGAGSLDEFFEVLTWRQLGLHSKPIILLNTEGYWDKLMSLMNHIIDEDFASVSVLESLQLCGTVEEVVAALRAARS